MDKLCRLCLNIFKEMACQIGDEFSDELQLLHKLSCVNMQESSNQFLPSFICQICYNMLKDMHKFIQKVSDNQKILLQQLEDGTLENFCQNLKNNATFTIKMEENDSCDVYHEPFDHKTTQIDGTKNNDEIQTKTEIITDENDDNLNSNIDVIEKSKHSKRKNVNKVGTQKAKKAGKYVEKFSAEEIANTNVENEKTALDIEDISNINLDTVTENISKSSLDIKENMSKTECHTDTTENYSKYNFDTTEIIFNAKFDDTKDNLFAKTDIDVNKDHKCLCCLENLSSNTDLIKHYKTVHSSFKKKSENDKTTEYSEEDELLNDDKIPKEGKELKLNGNEQKERPYCCKICGRTFVSVYAIVRHGRIHTGRPMYCSQGCGYTTSYIGALRDHERRHRNDYKYKCSTCGAGFHVKTWHDQHQNIHNNVKPFVCEVCGMAFHMHRYLTSHRSTVHPNVSKGADRYSCPHCDKTYNNIYTFRIHVEEHKGKSSFLCDVCGKKCSSKEQLKRHNKTHLGLKPFSCSMCNKKFSTKFNVSVHERAHTGHKHPCQLCGRHFAQRSTLLRHQRKRHPDNQ